MSRVSRTEPTRSARVPVSSNRAPLKFKGLDHENFSYRWVEDKDDRIGIFLEGGWTFHERDDKDHAEETKTDTGKELDTRVSKSAGFGGRKLYLMQIPMEFYKADQKAKQVEVDESESSMRRPGKGNTVGREAVDYGSISMDRGKMPLVTSKD